MHKARFPVLLDAVTALAPILPNMPAIWRMLTVYPDGYYFMQAERLCFVPFAAPCFNAQEVRKARVQLAQQARLAAV